MKAKRILAAMMAAAMASGILAGCNEKQETSSKAEESSASSSASSASSSEAEKEPERLYPLDEKGYPDLGGLKLSMWHRGDANDPSYDISKGLKEMVKYQEFAKACNFELDYVTCPIGMEKDSFSILMSSGEWPDMIDLFWFYYPGGFSAGLNDGVVLDTEPYLETYAPNFMKWMEEDEKFNQLAHDDSGKIIGFGGTYDDGGASVPEHWKRLACHLGPLIRGDFLEKAGLDVPTTIPDWYEALSAFKKMGVKVPYGRQAADRDHTNFVGTFSGAYGVYHDFMVREDGKVVYGPAEPAFKDYLAEMSKWYSEGLINPDYPNHKLLDNIMPMLASDEVGAMTCHAFDYWMYYVQPVVEKENAPEKDMIDCPFPTLTEGGPQNRFRQTIGGNIQYGTVAITSKTEYPEACVAVMDIGYSKELKDGFWNGVKGVTYDIAEDGSKIDLFGKLTNEERHINGGFLPLNGYNTYNEHEKPLHQRWADCCITWKNSGTSDGLLPKGLTFTSEEQDIISKYRTSFDDFANEWVMKFSTCAEPLEKFDEYVAGLQKLHMEDLVNVYQSAYDRFMAR